MPKTLLDIGLDKRKFLLVFLGLLATFTVISTITVSMDEASWPREPGIGVRGLSRLIRELPFDQFRTMAIIVCIVNLIALIWFIYVYFRTEKLNSAFSIKTEHGEFFVTSFKRPRGNLARVIQIQLKNKKLLFSHSDGTETEFQLPFPKYLEPATLSESKILKANQILMQNARSQTVPQTQDD